MLTDDETRLLIERHLPGAVLIIGGQWAVDGERLVQLILQIRRMQGLPPLPDAAAKPKPGPAPREEGRNPCV